MRIVQDNVEYQGTPDEIAEYFRLSAPTSSPAFEQNDFQPFETVVSESENLRRKLEKDPDYSPFAGVSKSPENEDKPNVVTPKAELDTGVEYI